MKIRSATFFHEPRSGKESGKETVLPLSAMLAKKQRTAPNQKDCPIFIKPYTMNYNKKTNTVNEI